jgi:hypothetical protein
VTITSGAVGTTVVSATSNIPVSGVIVARTTATSVNTTAGGSDNANKLWADDVVTTHVRDASGTDITGSTTVAAGTVVHDEATVARTAGTPAGVPDPTGTVTFTLYDNGTCNGNVLATDPNKPLVSGTATSVTFTVPATGGSFSYKAHYNGDANYPAHDATACEPFASTVVQVFAGCTPGFWKNHGLSLWDQPGDPLAVTVGFLKTTKFNTFFNLSPAQSGFGNSVSMLDALSSGGGGGIALARQGISALLSVGAGLSYQYPPGVPHTFQGLYDAIRNAYINQVFQPLETQLDAANSLEAPGLC